MKDYLTDILIWCGLHLCIFFILMLYIKYETDFKDLESELIQKDTQIINLKQECETLKEDIDTNYILKDKVKEWM